MEQFDYCKICLNRKVTRSEGIICGLTSEKPTFSKSCPDFNEDPIQKKRVNRFSKSYNTKEIYREKAQKSFFTGFPLLTIGILIYAVPSLNFGIGFLILIGALSFLIGIIFTIFGIIQFVSIQNIYESKDQKRSSTSIEDDQEIY